MRFQERAGYGEVIGATKHGLLYVTAVWRSTDQSWFVQWRLDAKGDHFWSRGSPETPRHALRNGVLAAARIARGLVKLTDSAFERLNRSPRRREGSRVSRR